MDDFCFERKQSRATTKLTLFTVNISKWHTKEDTGEYIKNAHGMLKGTSSDIEL